jgi:[glutamine synthetase] adenylyltransferase / [glutamine synthetase]-adenylyl-L-tyrosine phosphorylase
MDQAVFRLPDRWPEPADAGASARLRERFVGLGPEEEALSAQPPVAAMLACLGGNSPYLSDLAIRESAALRDLVTQGPDVATEQALAELRDVPITAPRRTIAAALRRAKRKVALAVAVADLGGLWSLEQVTGVLTGLAQKALSLAVSHLLRAAHDSGEMRLPDPNDPEQGCGFTVLGMGKLGAFELNYSSDIDLILLYDPAAGVYTHRDDGDAMAACYARLARNLVALMDTRDADGYAFRTDLRLRPDPSATPPAIALPGAISYYESMGENWERAAMSKARPVAGDARLGAAFLRDIRPFIWRRGLDFALLADIQAMKRRIDTHKGGGLTARRDPAARVAGHNVKLGEGGIREIEFLAQTLELVWGGRNPALREPTTLGALEVLSRAGHIAPHAADELASAYRFLRSVEHRLQMVADRQTHTLPERPNELARFALFMGFADAPAFADQLLGHLAHVRARYAQIFEQVPDPEGATADLRDQLDFSGTQELPPATAAAVRRLGFGNVEAITAAIRRWKAGHVRALRSERARQLIERMLPEILTALAGQPQPDAVFARFDMFLCQLPAGVQILSLFLHNPHLLERVAAVLGASPPLADHLARHPAALDGLLSLEDPDPAQLLQARLRDATMLEEAIGAIRRTVREEDFAIAVATMEGRLDADEAGLRRGKLADAALAALLPRVLADVSARNGQVRGGEMAVVALGKAGGREMMAGSDLDLMLVYDHPPDVTESSGARIMPATAWFVRAAQAYVAALTASGGDGPLYAVDMRLRPSGKQGPFAVSLASFQHYHAESAWTWERMALTRARVVAGPAPLVNRVEAAILAAIAAAGEPARIRADAAAMRKRMLRELPAQGPWDVKHRVGGLVEVEFIAQVLQLVHPRARGPCGQTTRFALAELVAAGLLLQADADLLIRADRVWRTVQGMLRITAGRVGRAALPEASARPLLRAATEACAPALDLPGLQTVLDDLAQQVRAAFVRHVGEIAQ